MSLRVRHIVLFLAATSFLFRSSYTTLGQQPPQISPDEPAKDVAWVAEAICDDGVSLPAYVNDRQFRLCFKVDYKQLRPNPDGRPNESNLTIVSFTKRPGKNLGNVGLTVHNSGDNPGLIIEPPRPNGPERIAGPLSSSKEFVSRLSVQEIAKAHKYSIDVSITSGNDTGTLNLSLPIAPAADGALEVLKDSQRSVDCWTGSNCSSLKLNLRNLIPYRLQNGQVTIASSEPSDLVADEVAIDPKSIAADDSDQVKLVLRAQPMSFSRIFSGFGKSPRLTATIKYWDEFGRSYSTQSDVYLQIKPNVLVLTIFLLLGVVVGTVIRIDLRRLRKAGLITKGQQAFFAATTFGSGILVCLIALFANLKIVVLDDQNSYSAWDPKVLFLTALVGTIGGIPIIYGFLKLPKQLEPSPGAGTDPKPAPSPDDSLDDLGQRRRRASTKRSR